MKSIQINTKSTSPKKFQVGIDEKKISTMEKRQEFPKRQNTMRYISGSPFNLFSNQGINGPWPEFSTQQVCGQPLCSS